VLWDQGKYAEAEPLLRQYDIEVGGTVEESAKSQASVFAVVPAMLFITVTLLIIQLQSFSRMFLVLSVVPIGPDWRRRRVAHFA
jgi:multidrug efflux pump subunit AcrB